MNIISSVYKIFFKKLLHLYLSVSSDILTVISMIQLTIFKICAQAIIVRNCTSFSLFICTYFYCLTEFYLNEIQYHILLKFYFKNLFF